MVLARQFLRNLVPVGLIFGTAVALSLMYFPFGDEDWDTGRFISRALVWGAWISAMAVWTQQRGTKSG